MPHVDAEIIASKKAGAFRQVTLAAPGVPEQFRAGNFVAVTTGDRFARRAFWIHRVKETGSFGPTVDVIVDPTGPGSSWLAAQPVGTKVPVTGPLGRPFAIPKEAVPCLLLGEGHSAAPLFPLAQRLRERGCPVTLVISGVNEAHVLSALEARRSARSVMVLTADGSVGTRGAIPDHVDDLLSRSEAAVVYACGPTPVLHAVALTADQHHAWSQVALEVSGPCGTGLCHGCALPVLGEDGVARTVRACHEGPVVRGDRVRWGDL